MSSKGQLKGVIRIYYEEIKYSQRVMNSWNKLLKNNVQVKKTSGFKAHFDKNEDVSLRASSAKHIVKRGKTDCGGKNPISIFFFKGCSFKS